MLTSLADSCIDTLIHLSPIVAIPLVFALGYLAIGIPIQLRINAAARDIWGTAAGVCAAAVYAAVLVGIVPAPHHVPSASSLSITRTH